jgi:hypothetical protein
LAANLSKVVARPGEFRNNGCQIFNLSDADGLNKAAQRSSVSILRNASVMLDNVCIK